MLNLLVTVYSLSWVPVEAITTALWLAAGTTALITAADNIHLRHMKGLR